MNRLPCSFLKGGTNKMMNRFFFNGFNFLTSKQKAFIRENQIFVKAENKETVATYVKNNGGEIVSMVRYEVGEGMEKREENFAEEVMKQING